MLPSLNSFLILGCLAITGPQLALILRHENKFIVLLL